MISDKAKAAILDKCCQKVDCLARGEVIDLEGALDASQTSPETETLARRLEHCIITMQNDDLSKPGTEKRARHVYRSETMRDVVEYLRAGHAQTPDQWRPIETAPKDGTRILMFQPRRGAFEGWWHDGWPSLESYWMDLQDSEPEPTHWQPLLAEPSASPDTSTEGNSK
jgi:hypothetical protein